jgi:PAS domain S-box-containing protein
MPINAMSAVLDALAAAFGVQVRSSSSLSAAVRAAALLAATEPFETRPIVIDAERYLSGRGSSPRMLIVLGPYRVPRDPESDAPLLSAEMETRAAAALAATTRAYSELDQIHRERLELASQLEVVSNAVIAITGQLGIEIVLQRIVDLARELAGARYTALGVPNAQGEMESFITSGMTADEEAAIGHRPRGLGILGLLLHEPQTIRLTDLKQHPASIGFPPNHPPMKSFLGVPIVIRGRVLGNLYLTEKRSGAEFTDGDARLVEILARHAAVAIENAQLYHRLELDRLRLQLLIEQMPEAIIVVEPNPERVTIVNRQASELLGWSIEAPVPLDTFLEMNPRFDRDGSPIERWDAPLVQSLLLGKVLTHTELTTMRPDGKQLTILVNGAPLVDDYGNVIAAVAVFQDYTRLKDAEQLKDDFLSLISHELRTPLTTIRGGSYMLAHEGSNLDASAREALLADIERESERLQFIIENMVQLANIRAGRYTMETEPLHMRLVIARAVEATREAAPDRQFDVSVEPNLFAEADPISVDQILLNLLRNAIKYTPTGSRVEVSARGHHGMVEVAVRDHGPGISDEDLPHVFERFRRGSASQRSRVEGMGVGLYLAKNLVEAHGGTIRADRPPDGGTLMRFTLPALAED